MVKTFGIHHPDFQEASREEIYAYFKEKEYVQMDLETTSLDCHSGDIMCMQLGDYDNQYVVKGSCVNEFRTILERRTLIGHNIKFDLRFLYKKDIWPNKVYDTFLAECVLFCGVPTAKKGLDRVAEKRLGVNLDKSVREGIWNKGLIREVIEYAADDVKYLELIRDSQLHDLQNQDLEDALEIDNQFVLCLAYIEFCGFKLHEKRWTRKCEKDKLGLKEAKKKIDNYVVEKGISKFIDHQIDLFDPTVKCSINWNSAPQVIELFEILGIPTEIVEDGEEKHSVSASNIEKYEKEFPFVRDYLSYREQMKLVSTYGYNFIHQIHEQTGRLHTSFKQIMNTGRLSSGGTDKMLNIKHLNFQNIPADAETRACFIPEKGNVLVGCDYSAQEDIVFTQMSQEEKLLEFYNDDSGRDGHSYVAKLCFPEKLGHIEENEVKKKRPDLRTAAKAAKFALHYGGNGSTIARNLNIPVEAGTAIEMAYFEAFPGIAQYFKTVKAVAIADGFVTFNPISRRKSYIFKFQEFKRFQREINKLFWERYRIEKQKMEENKPNSFLDMKDKVSQYFKLRGMIERKALNYPIQGTSGEITKISCIYIWNWIRKNKYQNRVLFVNTIHDENVLECGEELGEEVAAALQDCMERAGAIYCTDVKLKAVPVISKHWEK